MISSDVRTFVGLMVPPVSHDIPKDEEQKDKELGPVLPAGPTVIKEVLNLEDALAIADVDPQRALAFFNKALMLGRLNPVKRFEHLFGRAKAYFIQQTEHALELAEKDLQEALNLPSKAENKTEVYLYLALIYISRKDDLKASQCFKEGWNLCKSNRQFALDYLKFLNEQEKNYEGALEVCDQALKEDRYSTDLLYTKTKILIALESWLKACQAVDACLELGKMDSLKRIEVLDCASIVHKKTKSYEPALKYLQEANRLDSSLAKRIERSKKMLEIKLSIAPLDVLTTSMIKLSKDKVKAIASAPEKTLEIFVPMIDLFKNRADIIECLLICSLACIETKNPEHLLDAKSYLERLMWIIPEEERSKLAFAKVLLARIKMKEKRFEESLKCFKEAWKLDPKLSFDGSIYLPDDFKDWDWALGLCIEALVHLKDFNVYYAEAKIHAFFGKWREVRLDCHLFLEKCTSVHHIRKLEIYDLAVNACMNGDDLESAYQYMKLIYELSPPAKIIHKFEELSQLYKRICQEIPNHKLEKPTMRCIYNAAENKMNYAHWEKALSFYDYMLEHSQELEEETLIMTLIGRARTCIKGKFKEKFASATQNLNDAVKYLKNLKNHSPFINNAFAELYSCRALMKIEENVEFEKVLEDFEEGWKIAKPWKLRVDFSDFLVSSGDLDGALDLSNSGDIGQIEVIWRSTFIYRVSENWDKVIQLLDSLLDNRKMNDKAKKMVLKDALEISLRRKDYFKAKKYALQICNLSDFSASFIEQIEILLDVNRGLLIDDHLDSVSKNFPLQSSTINQLIQVYETELKEHPKHHVHLLKIMGDKYFDNKTLDLAYQAYCEALKVIDTHNAIFTKAERVEIEDKIEPFLTTWSVNESLA